MSIGHDVSFFPARPQPLGTHLMLLVRFFSMNLSGDF